MAILASAECDICGSIITWEYVGKTYIIRFARKRGWTVSCKEGKDVVICPMCRRRGKDDER